MHLAASAIAFAAIRRRAWAQIYPSRPVRLAVAYPPGGSADVIARVLGQRLAERLGQPVVIYNRPGDCRTVADGRAASLEPLSPIGLHAGGRDHGNLDGDFLCRVRWQAVHQAGPFEAPGDAAPDVVASAGIPRIESTIRREARLRMNPAIFAARQRDENVRRLRHIIIDAGNALSKMDSD